MSWRLAGSLRQLRGQIDAQFPQRSKRSDGTIGDARHMTGTSDHNPWVKDGEDTGVVTAIDFTHDPEQGIDIAAFAEHLREQRDPRIKYVIANERIFSSRGPKAWEWQPYTGANPHRAHIHISVHSHQDYYDDDRDWIISSPPQETKT